MTDADYATLNRTIVETSDTDISATGNSLVKRDGNGSIINISYQTTQRVNDDGTISAIWVDNGDGWLRRRTLSSFKTQISGTGLNADTLDGQQDTAYLRYRGVTNSSAEDKDPLWNQVGIRQYDATLPPDLEAPYNYGAVVSLPAKDARLEFYYSHHSSNGAYADPNKQVYIIELVGGQKVNWLGLDYLIIITQVLQMQQTRFQSEMPINRY